jgi:hypothetical protein
VTLGHRRPAKGGSRSDLPPHVADAIVRAEAKELAEVSRRSLIREAEARIDAGPPTGGVKRILPSPNQAAPSFTAPRAKGRPAPSPYRSQLEADYAQRLELQRIAGEVLGYDYEGMRLNLGGGAWYKPDFLILPPSMELTLAEVKGFWREAARVRIKVAAAKYPYLRFVAVTREDGVWREECF